jgi:hypothetical protein
MPYITIIGNMAEVINTSTMILHFDSSGIMRAKNTFRFMITAIK